MWEVPNNDSPAFTLMQVRLDNDSGVEKSSLEGVVIKFLVSESNFSFKTSS
jgi:hypothetical protein